MTWFAHTMYLTLVFASLVVLTYFLGFAVVFFIVAFLVGVFLLVLAPHGR
jgi:hypothetical protein